MKGGTRSLHKIVQIRDQIDLDDLGGADAVGHRATEVGVTDPDVTAERCVAKIFSTARWRDGLTLTPDRLVG